MKKLLSMFGAIGLVATSSATVVSCSKANLIDISGKDISSDFTVYMDGVMTKNEAIFGSFVAENMEVIVAKIKITEKHYPKPSDIKISKEKDDGKTGTATIAGSKHSKFFKGKVDITFTIESSAIETFSQWY